jgi:hypothetical protein
MLAMPLTRISRISAGWLWVPKDWVTPLNSLFFLEKRMTSLRRPQTAVCPTPGARPDHTAAPGYPS